jgi:hypothetical protein
MSEQLLRRGGWLLGALLLATAPHAVRAQQSAEEQLASHLIATARVHDAINDSLSAARAENRRILPPDSIRSGPLRVFYKKENLGAETAGLLATAVDRASKAADSTFGDDLEKFALHRPIGVIAIPGRWSIGTYVRLEIEAGGSRSVLIRPPVTERKLEDAITDLTGTMATAGWATSTAISSWDGEWIPPRHSTHEEWEDAAINLATSPSAVARSCHTGSIAACDAALGLTPSKDPLTDWYTPDGWRVLVGSWHPPKDAFEVIKDRSLCIEKRDDAACARAARTHSVPIPLAYSTRATLLATAFEIGGRQAYHRLINATGTPMDGLALAAGVSADSLVRVWRTRVLSATPRSSAPTIPEAALFAGWFALLGVASTRRRP